MIVFSAKYNIPAKRIQISKYIPGILILTHPASSIFTTEEAPLSRGDFPKGRLMTLEPGNSPLERGGCGAAGVCRILHKTRIMMKHSRKFSLIFLLKSDNFSKIRIAVKSSIMGFSSW
jgi:hypothetical protein